MLVACGRFCVVIISILDREMISDCKLSMCVGKKGISSPVMGVQSLDYHRQTAALLIPGPVRPRLKLLKFEFEQWREMTF
jgi:hypothetical protein